MFDNVPSLLSKKIYAHAEDKKEMESKIANQKMKKSILAKNF